RGGRQRGPWPGSPRPAIRRGHGARVARRGRVGTARAAPLGLQLLEDHASRFGHHLLHDLAHRLAVGLELRDQRGENREVALLGLRLDGTLTRALHTHLELRTRAGGPFEGGHPGLYNFNHTFQNRSPAVEVDESYADLHLRSADVRIGIQKVAWGKLDGVPP